MKSPLKPQQKKTPDNSDQSVRQKVLAAKTTLGLKDVNVASAISGHKKVKDILAKNSNLPFNQVLNRLPAQQRKDYISMASHVPSDSLEKDVSMTQFRRQLNILKPSRKPLMNSFDVLDKEQVSESLQDEIQPPPMLVLRRKGIRIFPDGRRVALYTHDKLGLVFTIPYTPNQVSKPVTIPGVQSENVELDEKYQVVAQTKTGEKFKSGLYDSKKDAQSMHYKLAKGNKHKDVRIITAEETDLMESLEQVAAYAQQDNVTSHAKHFKFADGSKLKVSHGAAKAIHMVHGALNDENKKKFADMLTTPKGFEKAAHFALSKVKFSIGGE